MPAQWGRSKVQSLQWLKDKILRKIQGWKGALLNHAGKEVLIKAVLQAIPAYAMAIIKFPKTFCNQISSKIAQFWWRGKKERGIHWKKWSSLTMRKEEGGMGFKDLEIMNQSLLAKQAWRIYQDPSALWARVLKGIYFPNKEFLSIAKARNVSWAWSSLLSGRDLLLDHGQWNIGTGEKVDISKHRWIASGEKLTGGPSNQKVCDLIDRVHQKWKVETIQQIFPSTDIGKILQTPFSILGGEDRLFWPQVPSGLFTVKSGYRTAKAASNNNQSLATSSSHPTQFLWLTIWGAKIPQKIKSFLWKACNNALPVKKGLKRRNLVRDEVCPICSSVVEDINHTLLGCDWTRAVWFGSPFCLAPQGAPTSSFACWLESFLSLLTSADPDPTQNIAYLAFLLWEIWKMRNRSVFEGLAPNPRLCLKNAASLLLESVAILEGQIHLQNDNSSQSFPIHWKKPPASFLKCNTDASFSLHSRKASGAYIFRDESGSVSCGAARKFYANSPLGAEALILREAVQVALNLDQKKVIFESDYKQLIETCNGDRHIGEIANIIQDIKVWKASFPDWSFIWTPREGNAVAHSIAQLASSANLPPLWLWNPPPSLLVLLNLDRRYG